MMMELVPLPARLLVLALVGGVIYAAGWLAGNQHAGQQHLDYVAAQAKAAQRIAVAQTKVIAEVRTEYVDRIKVIKERGEQIEKQVPVYITAADDGRCSINAGFVRIHDAAWQGADPGPAAGADREPAGVSLAEVAEASAANAASCRQWREQALSLRQLYQQLQKVTNQ